MSIGRWQLGLLISSIMLLLLAPAADAQQPGRGGFAPGPARGGPLELLQREDVRRELELLPNQVERLEGLGERLRGEMQSSFAGLRELDAQERASRIRELQEELRETTERQIGEVLMPHQVRRLNQLSNQMRMRGGTARALVEGELADELGLDQATRERLRERSQEVEAELRRRLAELRREAQEELLLELTTEQREAYRELVGAPFEFDEQPRPAGREGFRGAGGGGFRGGEGFGGARGEGRRGGGGDGRRGPRGN